MIIEDHLITEPQRVLDNHCLADLQTVPGFDWALLDDPDRLAFALAARQTAARQVVIERPGDSPNQGGFGQQVPSPCREVVWHWWGNPVGQAFDGIVHWLRMPASQVSAHLVITAGRAAQILPWTSPSWANGNTWANANSITIEADPNDIWGTIATGIELLIHLVATGVLHPDFRLTGHRDHYGTACPGDYYPHLAHIRQQVAAGNPEEDNMPLTDQDLDRIGHRVWGHMIDTGEHAAAAWARLADAENRVIALCDGRAPLAPRSEHPGAHAAPIGLALGNVEARVIALDDRTRAIETQLAEILQAVQKQKEN